MATLFEEAWVKYFKTEVTSGEDKLNEYEREQHIFKCGWEAYRSVVEQMGYNQLLVRIDTKGK